MSLEPVDQRKVLEGMIQQLIPSSFLFLAPKKHFKRETKRQDKGPRNRKRRKVLSFYIYWPLYQYFHENSSE
jgi:hypothetical protein